MLNAVRRYVPPTWNNTNTDHSDVPQNSEEYQQISFEVGQAFTESIAPQIRRMIRVQDLHSYGQFLIREQLLLNSDTAQLYRVRFYVKVNRIYLNEIIKYNLDPRRCGMGQSITFQKTITSSGFSNTNVVVVVKVLTREPNSQALSPSSSCDYYVEYIIEF